MKSIATGVQWKRKKAKEGQMEWAQMKMRSNQSSPTIESKGGERSRNNRNGNSSNEDEIKWDQVRMRSNQSSPTSESKGCVLLGAESAQQGILHLIGWNVLLILTLFSKRTQTLSAPVGSLCLGGPQGTFPPHKSCLFWSLFLSATHFCYLNGPLSFDAITCMQ